MPDVKAVAQAIVRLPEFKVLVAETVKASQNHAGAQQIQQRLKAMAAYLTRVRRGNNLNALRRFQYQLHACGWLGLGINKKISRTST